jgi:PST family polysaccharide transporter
VAAQAVYLVTVISAAMILKSYWALILGIAAEQLSRFVLSYLMHSFRPRLAWKPDRSLFAFSFWYWLSGIASFFSTRSDAFIIGRLIGVESLGLYHISQRLAKMTSNEISEPVARALVPGYAILAEDSSSLRHVYLNAISGLIMVGAPLAATLAFIPEPIVRLLFGEQWLTAIPLIRVMAAGALLQILTIQNQVLLFQINREKQVTALAFVRLAILVPAIAIGATYWGLLGVATGVVLTGLVTWTANQTIVSRDIGLSGSQVAGCLLRPISAALATGALLLVLSRHLDAAPTALAGALQLVALLGVGALVYVALILLLWIVAGRPNDLVANLLSKLRRKLPFRSSLSP